MIDGKLLKLLRKLDQDEFRRFYKWLKSPFMNTNVHLIRLYELLRKYYPELDSPKLKKEKVFAKLFPDLTFNKEKLAALNKRMIRLTEDYLLWIEGENKEFERRNKLLKVYARRNLFDLYERGRFRILEELERQPYRDLEYYKTLYTLDFDYFFHPLTQKHTLDDEVLIRLMNNIDKQFILAKYRIGSEMKNRERILRKTYEIRFLESIEKETEEGFFGNNISFQLFQPLFDLYDPAKASNAFIQLKKRLSND